MDLSRIRIEPRLRSSWEAVDLGFVMARHWYWPLLLCWSLPLIAIATLFTLLLPDRLWLAILSIWWFKPLLDRAPLYFLSLALFDEPITVRRTLRRLPTLWRPEWVAWLTWRRFNPTRAFDMPVTLLEGLSGRRRSERLQVLHRQNTGAAIWLTLVCAHLEALLVFGIVALVALLVPSEANLHVFSLFMEDGRLAQWISHALTLLSMALIAPFYVASGFALYISRRIELEAWDVEIRFRHLAQSRRRRSGPSVPGSAAIVVLLASACLTLPTPGLAESNSTTPNTQPSPPVIENREDARAIMDDILAGEAFHATEEVTRWRLKPREADDATTEALPEWFITLIEWLEALFAGDDTDTDTDTKEPPDLGLIFEVLLWGAALLLLILVVYRFRREFAELLLAFEKPASRQSRPPRVLFGLDVSEESLPGDITARVRQLCTRGEFREALSLLYRATLSRLMHQRGFRFHDSYTEGECVAVVHQGNDPQLSRFTEELTLSWQRLAYGHQQPSSQQVDRLCERWREVFPDEA